MKRIPLRARDGSVRAFALVDDEDFERFGAVAWSAHSEGYAYRWEAGSPRRCVLLHRAIMGLRVGDRRQVDHRNLDRLDCRRENLRVTTQAGNQQNVRARAGARSRFRGVSWHKRYGRWQARVGASWLGTFDDELEAAVAAERARREAMPLAEPDPELAKALATA